MRLPQRLLLAFLAAQLAATARAGVTAIKAVQVPQDVVANHVVNDLLIDFTGILRGQQLIVELDQGSIFQCPTIGTHPTWLPPIDPIIGVMPACEYDTYVGFGERKNSTQPILVVGGAVGLEPGAAQQFDSNGLNIAWAPGTGIDIQGPKTDYFIARITLSNNALGTIRYFGSTSAGSGDPHVAAGAIRNGVIIFGVPEPASAWLFGLAASWVCWNYRKRFTKREIV